jgi:hypothetical protein
MFLQSTEAQEFASRSADMLHLIETWRLEVKEKLRTSLYPHLFCDD